MTQGIKVITMGKCCRKSKTIGKRGWEIPGIETETDGSPPLGGMLQWRLRYQMGTWTRWIHICKPKIYYRMLLSQGTSKTSSFKGTPNFMIPSLPYSYQLSLDLWPSQRFHEPSNTLPKLSSLTLPNYVWDVWNQEFWLTQDEYLFDLILKV